MTEKVHYESCAVMLTCGIVCNCSATEDRDALQAQVLALTVENDELRKQHLADVREFLELPSREQWAALTAERDAVNMQFARLAGEATNQAELIATLTAEKQELQRLINLDHDAEWVDAERRVMTLEADKQIYAETLQRVSVENKRLTETAAELEARIKELDPYGRGVVKQSEDF